MAIKIKNKSKKEEVVLEEESHELEEELEEEMPDAPDGFQQSVAETAVWASNHTTTVVIGLVVVVLLGASSYFLLNYLESRKVQASSEMNEIFVANSWLIKDSDEYKALENQKLDFQVPSFDTEKDRQESILKTAQLVTQDGKGEPIEVAALLAEASAELKLGNPDNATKFYQDILEQTSDDYVKIMAHFGLSEAYTAQKKYDDALKSINNIESMDSTFAKGLRLAKAKLYESMGNREEAKKLYHEILDDDSAGLAKSDIERRLANL